MINISVIRYVCGHESVLGNATVTSGEPYVLAHHDATDFADLIRGLALTGHAFSVSVTDHPVCLLEMADRLAIAPSGQKDD